MNKVFKYILILLIIILGSGILLLIYNSKDNEEIFRDTESKTEDDLYLNVDIKDNSNNSLLTITENETYSYDKYTIVKSNDSSENIGFWFGRNKDFKRPNSPLSINELKEYNSYYIGNDTKVIYLTFDEGINDSQANKNLDTLKKHNIKATFFVTKGFIEANPEIVTRMKNEGHVIGNHTYSHPNMAKVAHEDPERFIKELIITDEAFKEVTGTEMDKVFRFPEGTFSKEALDYANQLGYKSIFWSFAYKDWDADWNSKDEALEWMKNYYHPGAIYLLHGVNKANAEALDEFIIYMKDLGYEFDVVTNLN